MFWTRWAVVCLVGASVLLGAGAGRAAEAEAPAMVTHGGYKQPFRVQPQAPPEKVWYGYQTLAVDGVVLALLLAGGRFDQPSLFWLGAGAYLLGAPLVHLAHGGGGAALRSFALRLAPPAILALGLAACAVTIGAMVAYGEDAEVIDPFAIFLGVGAISVGCGIAVVGVAAFPAAVAVDARRLAYERVEPPPAAKPQVQSVVLPLYDPARRAGMVAWAGTF